VTDRRNSLTVVDNYAFDANNKKVFITTSCVADGTERPSRGGSR
jgi:hypothetical protein